MSPPTGVEYFHKGDRIDFDVELITLPKSATDYYGDNNSFRSHLQEHLDSWRTIHREANMNDLQIKAIRVHGTVVSKYPVIIEAVDENSIQVDIIGGVGAIPIKFERLSSKNYDLYKLGEGKPTIFAPQVHGNDYWQTNYSNGLYSLTYNIPIEGSSVPKSSWMLQKRLNNVQK